MERNIKRGILAGGNWIIDNLKVIDIFPGEERLANILEESTSNGGAPFNLLKALYQLEVAIPLEAIGVIGDDNMGIDILQECRNMKINTSQMTIVKGVRTSYTDVMTVAETGRRTFFHYRGANALLDETHFDFSISDAKIFHLGYLLLLDKLDTIGEGGLTGAAKVLKRAKELNFITSADIVSEESERFKEIIPVSLKFIDILFINDFEIKMLTGIKIFDDQGKLLVVNGYKAAKIILDLGVNKWVIIHFPKGVLALNKKGIKIFQPSVNIPNEKIKGTVGAGDALAAGVLSGVHEGWSMKKSILLGVSVAAASLMDITSCNGITSLSKCMQIGKSFGYNEC